MTMKGSEMLVKLQTTDSLIYAELDKTERVTHLASKNRIPLQACYAILHEIEARGDLQITWALPMTGIPIPAYLEELRGDAPYFMVSDSALYTAANLATLSNVRFITRVPETLTAVKALYESLSIEDMRPASENGYRYHCVENTYAGVDQRWLVVYSEAAYKREVATLEKQIAKERKTAEKATQHLRCKEFDTEMDAHEAARLISASWRYHKFSKVERVCVPHYPHQGRPKKDAHPTRIGFRIVAEILQDAEAIQAVKKQKGKFVLATNELDATLLDEATMLSAYKAQNVSVERGFRFLKDPLFFASSLFLEKPQRIMALLMVMGLALLIYALAERWLRTELIKQNPNPRQPSRQTDPTPNPTAYFSSL